MDLALQKRIERAHILSNAGHSTKDIAAQYKVEARTVRRWLARELDDETKERIEIGTKEDVDRFSANAWRTVHKLAEQIEDKLDKGEFKAKDLAVSLGILIDKLRAIAPQVVEEEETVTKTVFEMYCPAKEEQRARELFETWKAQYLEGEAIEGVAIEDGQDADTLCLTE